MAGWLMLCGGSTAILLIFALRASWALRRLRESEGRYRSLVETASELICTVDLDGCWTFLNRDATRRLLGYEPEELLGHPFVELLLPEDVGRHLDTFARVLTGEERTEYEATLVRKNGTRVVLSFNTTSLRDGPGHVAGALATGADVTERKQASQHLEQQNRILHKVAAGESLASSLGDLMAAVEGRVAGMRCAILLLDEASGRFEAAAAPGLRDSLARAVEGIAGDLAAAADRAGRPRAIHGGDHPEVAAACGLAACWSEPVRSSTGGVLGALALLYPQRPGPTEEEAGLIQGSAHLVAIAVEAARSRDRLVHSALHDALTGLPNRTLFLDRLDVALRRTQRRPERLFAVLFIDLDRFKLVNDSFGHLGGDELLQAIADRLRQHLRPADTLARLGGDEFALLVEDLAEEADASRLALRIQQDFATPFEIEGHEVFSSASVGIALATSAYSRPVELMRDADIAMYRAKAAGRSRYAVFDPAMHQRALSQLRIESALRRALGRRQFRLFYQPIVELAGGQIVGFEALLRWEHPELGLLAPDAFLAACEETGILPPLGEWVLEEACGQVRAWQELGPETADLKVNVNLHVAQIVPQKLAAQVRGVLAETGLAASSLNVEITEGVLLQGTETAFTTLGELRALGLGVCLDDFGTGYSSLSYLPSFPVTTLKIDRSFVSGLHQRGQLAVVEAITSLSHALGLAVVAEGLETEAQLATLRGLGCEQAQGFLFSRPLAGPAVLSLLAGEPSWQERAFRSRPGAALPRVKR